MSKPFGLALEMHDGLPHLNVKIPHRASDAIWDAVQLAISYGMTPTQFINEASEAWEQELRDQAKDAAAQFRKAAP